MCFLNTVRFARAESFSSSFRTNLHFILPIRIGTLFALYSVHVRYLYVFVIKDKFDFTLFLGVNGVLWWLSRFFSKLFDIVSFVKLLVFFYLEQLWDRFTINWWEFIVENVTFLQNNINRMINNSNLFDFT